MTDYGHDIRFGTFIVPSSVDPQRVLDHAALSESLGFELAAFQDHPYQPAFLDTWTLLAFLAARTTRITLSADVTNLPLRPPAMLAKATASLDILSGGRIELALGAGGFWEAIEALGGRRLTPGQSVDALDEAITIIRELWNTSERGGARFAGEYYSLSGAKRGPAPAHVVPISVGAYKPRMLRLVGRQADGWLPSLYYLDPSTITQSNATIDAAATRAGRSPGDIRRLVNVSGSFTERALPQGRGTTIDGPPEHWVDTLSSLAVEHGFSTFIVSLPVNPPPETRDSTFLKRFAVDVAPEVRAKVDAVRAQAR